MSPEQIAEEMVAALAGGIVCGTEAAATHVIARVIRRVIEDEREACALTALRVSAEHLKGNPLAGTISTPDSVLYIAAQLIRARGNHA